MKYIYFFLIIIYSTSLQSQVTEAFIIEQIDSLIEIRAKDTPKALSLAKRAYKNATTFGKEEWISKISTDYGILLFLSKQHTDAIAIFKKAIPIADEHILRSRLCTNLAMVYEDLEKVDSAFYYNEIAIKELETIGDSINITRPTFSMVKLLKRIGNYQEALERLLAVKNLFHQTGDINLIMSYDNIRATTLMDLKDYQSAINQLNSNIEYIESIKDEKYKNATLKAKAQALTNMGLCHFYLKNRKKALYYYDQALEIQKAINQVPLMGIIIFNIAESYLEEGELMKAELYCIQSYNIFKDVKDKKGEMLANSLLGSIYTQRGHFIEANEKYAIAENIALEIDLTTKLTSVYENWSESLENQQNYKTALEYYKKRTELNDSLFNREKQQRIDVLNMQYETFKNESEIEKKDLLLEKKDRQIMYGRGLSAVAVVISGLLGLLLYFLRDRNKQEQIKEQILNDNFDYFEASNPHLSPQEVVKSKPEQEKIYITETKEVIKDFMILTNKRHEKLHFKDILHISSKSGQGSAFYYCVDTKKPYYDNQSMKKLAAALLPYGFIRIHNQHIINYHHLKSNTSKQAVLSDNSTLPIGRGFKENLQLHVRSLEN